MSDIIPPKKFPVFCTAKIEDMVWYFSVPELLKWIGQNAKGKNGTTVDANELRKFIEK